MGNIGKIIHKYDVADFDNYYYWQIYFAGSGLWTIDGTNIQGVAGVVLDSVVGSTPVNISGSTELYLLGDIKPYLGPDKPTIVVSANTPTNYYYGNLGQGSGINGQTGYFN